MTMQRIAGYGLPLVLSLSVAMGAALPPAAARVGATTKHVSVASDGLHGNDSSGVPPISGQVTQVTGEIWNTYLPVIRHRVDWAKYTEWTPWGLSNEAVIELTAGPIDGELWALTPSGLLLSTTHGQTWQRADVGLPAAPSVVAVADGDLPNGLVYAASWRGEVYVSRDSGATWTLDSDLGEPLSFLGFVDGSLYAGNRSAPHWIRRQLPTGAWEAVGDGVNGAINDVASFRSTLYAAATTGLYRLVGNQWQSVTVEAPVALSDTRMTWVPPLLSPEVQRHSEVTTARPFEVYSILVQDGMAFVSTNGPRRLYRSADGDYWSGCDVGITDAFSRSELQLVASDSGRLFAGGTDGVFISDSQGQRWQILDAGLPHSSTAYGVVLDGISATSLTLVKDDGGAQTLGAVFNGKGVWLFTVTDGTLLQDLPPESPPKAVLVVGPVDPPAHAGTRGFIDWAERLATVMESKGLNVVRVYWPYSTWENVRAAISGASIVVYKGHGFGLNDLPSDPDEMYGGLNGFCLVHPEDPSGARLGTQDMLVTTSRLAENAVGFFFCCYCGGGSSSDPSPVAEELARRRIEAYSSTVLRMGGSAYFSCTNEEAILLDMFAHPDKTLGDIYRSIHGDAPHGQSHILWPDVSVWFDGNPDEGWGEAFVGDPTLTARDVLGW